MYKNIFTMVYLRLFASVLVLLSIPVGLRAQEAMLSVKFRMYSVNGDIEGLRCVTAGGPVEAEVSGRRRSEPMQYYGPSQIVFFKPSEQIEGEPIKPFATATLNANVRNPLLVFIRMRTSADSSLSVGTPLYRIIVLPDDPLAFKDGGMKFINLTSKAIVMVGGQNDELKASLTPGEVVSYQLSEDFRGNFPIKIATRSSTGWQLLMDSRVFPTLQARDIYFISPIPNRKAGHQVRISNLRERGDNAKIRLNLHTTHP